MSGNLGWNDSEEVLSQVAQVTMAKAPLVDGLRAAAAESTRPAVRSSLSHLAARLSQGQNLQDALSDSAARMPPHVRGLVAAAARTGRLGEALDELLEHHRSLRSMSWSIWGSLAYPLVVLLLAFMILTALMVWIVPQFKTLFDDFELKLPLLTEQVLHSSETLLAVASGRGKWVILLLVLGFLAVAVLGTGRGGAAVQRILSMMPVLGPLWRWSGAASFMRLLATLLEHQIPLPEALLMTSDGVTNAELKRVGVWLAEGVQKGSSLSSLVEQSGCLPESGVPVLQWGEKMGELSEAARTLSVMFEDRMWARTVWLRSALPPVIYLIVVLVFGIAVTALFVPLISLIQGLA